MRVSHHIYNMYIFTPTLYLYLKSPLPYILDYIYSVPPVSRKSPPLHTWKEQKQNIGTYTHVHIHTHTYLWTGANETNGHHTTCTYMYIPKPTRYPLYQKVPLPTYMAGFASKYTYLSVVRVTNTTPYVHT